MYGVIVVEVCASNPLAAYPLGELEEEFPGVTVLETECLSLCGLCQHNAYAYVNGRLVFAKDPKTCYERLRQRIVEEQTWLLDEHES
ncbi:uncharacterized protein YuzB (UPF0349 family) [Alicyclobacillus sacchari]|uniref:Uncharacterized protein YuzB (UPF0349 family) n=1 Tax=Alicyclobacillus sacchari TaxID=392010 RepID=A0A4R8LL53_9BACL|nr:DUF1450 domain-containing protein [Alicyclobacillus sacchari]TDY45264.1 uncharacterized protein YuzB (UPF0349 family) [Alicyclobacillus sacchari]GMA56880.1 hypothetical protein GCM10025858_13830 [Alicyclobacillus sacchari]